MSFDSWGGGSDRDPKLRQKENADRERKERHNRWSRVDEIRADGAKKQWWENANEEGEPIKKGPATGSSRRAELEARRSKIKARATGMRYALIWIVIFSAVAAVCIYIKPGHTDRTPLIVPVRF